MKGILISLLLISFTFATQKCENNSTFIEASQFCSCAEGFLGNDCSIFAYQLNQSQTKIPLTKNFTFAYYKPSQKVLYRILLTFCSAAKDQNIDFVIFVQEQQNNGQIELNPKKQREGLQMIAGGEFGCREIFSNVLVSVDKKPNDQLLKLVFGFRLTGKSIDLENQTLIVKCTTSSIFTVSFVATILLSFLIIATVFLLISIVIVVRKKWIERRARRRQSLKKLSCVNSLMPSQKYENLIEEHEVSPNHQQNETICSICLCDFGKGQDVRKTPCGHIYHSSCLESWCNTNLSCPICRQSFQKEQARASLGRSQPKTGQQHSRSDAMTLCVSIYLQHESYTLYCWQCIRTKVACVCFQAPIIQSNNIVFIKQSTIRLVMGKKTKITPKQKEHHSFILKGGKVQADFAPSKCISSMPCFNRDGKYYTPSFIIPSLYYPNKTNYQSQHQSKIEATFQKSQQNILVPRPKPNKNYCGVCAKDYQDYLQHISSESHKNELKSAQFTKQIAKLCVKIQAEQDEIRQRYMSKISSKSTIGAETQEEDETATKQGHCQTKIMQFRSQSQASGLAL